MKLPKRKLPRLTGYDYKEEGYYFVTICTYNRQNIFADPTVGNGLDHSAVFCNLNKFGKIAESELLDIPLHFIGVKIDKYVIMPDHVHAIVIIGCDGEAERSRPFPTLSTIIGLYKSGVSKIIHQQIPDLVIWQKSFNDVIIRNEKSYLEIWQYIDENLLKYNLGSSLHTNTKEGVYSK